MEEESGEGGEGRGEQEGRVKKEGKTRQMGRREKAEREGWWKIREKMRKVERKMRLGVCGGGGWWSKYVHQCMTVQH